MWIIDKINALAFIPFIRMKASIHSLFPPFFLVRQSVCWPRSQWVSLAPLEPLAQEAASERERTEGVKLTSPLENNSIHSRLTVNAANKV